MLDFDGQVWIVQDNDDLNFVCVGKRVKKKVQVLNERGREQTLPEDKLFWKFPVKLRDPGEWRDTASNLRDSATRLRDDIDVALLWETARELETSDLSELAELYFGGEIDTLHRIAVWLALAQDRLHFKRRGKVWEIRDATQIEELKIQRQREETRDRFLALAARWLREAAESAGKPEISVETAPFVKRLDCWMRGDKDKDVETLITELAADRKINPRELAFDILQKTGHLPEDADRDVIVAGLKPKFSMPVTEAALAVSCWQPDAGQTVHPMAFSIDDEETREVDDALAIERDGDLWKVSIAISDPASVVHRGDALDREAMRRGATVYLPTQSILMLPERISCDIASLTAAQARSAIVMRVWLDDEARIKRSTISRDAIQVEKRLHYKEADVLLAEGTDETAKQLRDLAGLAEQLCAHRVEEGALIFNQPEYKVWIEKNGKIQVMLIDRNSPSRLLVAEMMILTNHIAAKYAQRNQVPLIFRTQEAPVEPINADLKNDPIAFYKIRKLLRPSALSLQPAGHSGLGLSVYTQLSSPLRRFADLVIQRQLLAHLLEEPLPYDQDELFKVLAAAEHAARGARSTEFAAKRRWFLLYLRQEYLERPLEVLITDVQKMTYKVEMQPWGVDAILSAPGGLKPGQTVMARIEKLRPKAGQARLKLAKK
ncbi:MAG: RNB domain-containing ribonuclease [Gammaproteobacteria bacterium]|nr:RNB domain-containing ribonuclease [Gammaproteobacteria bacterium]